jgi:hypothetical protein
LPLSCPQKTLIYFPKNPKLQPKRKDEKKALINLPQHGEFHKEPGFMTDVEKYRKPRGKKATSKALTTWKRANDNCLA